MNDVSAIVQAVPAKYKGYFGVDSAFAKLPSLALNTPGEVFALVAALLSLEQVDVQALLKVAPGEAKSPAAFGEFDTWYHQPLSHEQMRRVWLRRLAVSLWSDASSHWPWHLKDPVMTLDQWDLLLGWNPESDELDDPNSAGFIAAAGGNDPTKADAFQGLLPGSQPKSISNKNGNYIFQRPDGKFHFSARWNPDPFKSWHIARSAIWPLLTQQNAPVDLKLLYGSFTAAKAAMSQVQPKLRFSAMLATTSLLRARGYSHPNSDVNYPSESSAIWPQSGLFPTVYDPAPPLPGHLPLSLYPARTCSFSDVWNSGFGLCHHTAPLLLSLLRSMNVPARVCFVRVPLTHADDTTKVFTTNHVVARATQTGGFMQPNHLAVAADIADARVAVYHADDVCSYHGNRFADAGFTWVQLDAWLATAELASLAQAAALDPSLAYAIDDALGKWPFTQIVRLRETQTRANLEGMAANLTKPPWSSWLASYAFVMNAPVAGMSWLSRWEAANKPGAGMQAIASVAADYFELDTNAIPDVFNDDGIGLYGHWGVTRFPINWFAGEAPPGFADFGLAADPQVQLAIAKIVEPLALVVWLSAKNNGGP